MFCDWIYLQGKLIPNRRTNNFSSGINIFFISKSFTITSILGMLPDKKSKIVISYEKSNSDIYYIKEI